MKKIAEDDWLEYFETEEEIIIIDKKFGMRATNLKPVGKTQEEIYKIFNVPLEEKE